MYIPKLNELMTVTLPGEVMRVRVIKSITNNAVMIQIETEPMAKLSHSYKNGDILGCMRKKTMMGEEWNIVSDKEIIRERDNAIAEREIQENRKQQHQRVDAKRKIPAKASSSNSPIKRKKTPKV